MSGQKPVTYSDMKRANDQCVAIINAVWGAKVAWVEDTVSHSAGGSFIYPMIRSRMVRGLVPGLSAPAFNPGPAKGLLK